MANILKAADLIAMKDRGQIPTEWRARDTAYKTRPIRTMRLEGFVHDTAQYYLSAHSAQNLKDFINLSAPDADKKLARYEIIS